MAPHLKMTRIVKRYGSLLANDSVDLEVQRGTVHAIVGENGAGKSTLMNVLYGLANPDSGTIEIDGRSVDITDPHQAIELGIGMVHQHFMLVPDLTVTENVILGMAPVRRGLIDRDKARAGVVAVSSEFGLDVDPDQRVADLPVGVQQRVEILKALYRQAEILVLDEPTAVLTPQEAIGLGVVMHKLAESGKSLIFISHKLGEVVRMSDEVTVMRRGKVTGHSKTSDTNEHELARQMVGRDVVDELPKPAVDVGKTVLSIRELSATNDRGQVAVHHVTFDVRAGSIVGIAGVEGNGQTELIECIAGLRSAINGSISLDGVDLTKASIRRRRQTGLAHIPEDRIKRGLAPGRSIANNLVAIRYRSPEFRKRGLVRHGTVRDYARRMIGEYEIAAINAEQPVSALSGGNMQKVVVARELSDNPPVVLISQPTRGVDIGAIENIHRQILTLRDAGCAILLVSSELEEVMVLADEMMVIYDGEVVARLDPSTTTEAEIGLHMAGVSPSASGKSTLDG